MIEVYLRSGIEFFVLVVCMVRREKYLATKKAWREANPERRKAYNKAWREANSDKVKAWREANSDKVKAYYETNSDKLKAYNKAWQKANLEKVTTYCKAYYETNSDKLKADSKAWQKANADKVKANGKAWRESNPEKIRFYEINRRALKHNSEGSLEFEDYFLIFEKHDYRCPYCGIDVADYFHLDHIVPLSKGGSSWVDNFQALCPTCNLTKNAKLPWDYENEINYQRPPNFYDNPRLYSGELN